jgi:translation initiation factor IF-3
MPSVFDFTATNIRRCIAISKENLRINEEIRVKEVRVVNAANEQLGIMLVRDALRLAGEQQLDLVEVAPLAKPPVCRIMDYGKFRYEQQKREKEAKKKQKVVTIKEVKVRPNIEDHDFYVKLKNAQRFLQDGDKVKATVMFRGRELTHPELGRQVLVRMAAELKEIANVERDPKLEGKNMIMILAAKQQPQQPQQN